MRGLYERIIQKNYITELYGITSEIASTLTRT